MLSALRTSPRLLYPDLSLGTELRTLQRGQHHTLTQDFRPVKALTLKMHTRLRMVPRKILKRFPCVTVILRCECPSTTHPEPVTQSAPTTATAIGNLRHIIRACPGRCIFDVIIAGHVFSSHNDPVSRVTRKQQGGGKPCDAGAEGAGQFLSTSHCPRVWAGDSPDHDNIRLSHGR